MNRITLSYELVDRVSSCLTLKFEKCLFWSDTFIALAWITKDPASLKSFVLNRVQEIESLVSLLSHKFPR